MEKQAEGKSVQGVCRRWPFPLSPPPPPLLFSLPLPKSVIEGSNHSKLATNNALALFSFLKGV